jgi:hypothetical protein
MRLKLLVGLLLFLGVAAVSFAQESPKTAARKLIPYDYYIDDLPNDLRVVTIPTDYPNLVAFYIVVGTGSRNEVEPGKTGYAHFFEHMMFRGSENYPPGKRDEIMQRAGAATNAYTTDDRTVYHATFSKEDLPEIMKMEADRFQRLKYAEPEYKTEALAVLGEYNKNIAAPTLKLQETLRATAFKEHTYKHTTMGFIQDIEDMPNQFDYSWEFFRRYYRPEYTTILVVGDVTREEVVEMVRANFGTWERGNYKPEIPREPEQSEPRTAHVDWATPTLPYVTVAFHNPAYSTSRRIMPRSIFSQRSRLAKTRAVSEARARRAEGRRAQPIESGAPGSTSVHGHRAREGCEGCRLRARPDAGDLPAFHERGDDTEEARRHARASALRDGARLRQLGSDRGSGGAVPRLATNAGNDGSIICALRHDHA